MMQVVIAGGVADNDAVAAFGDGASDIRLSKKRNARGSTAWCMLLPLNPKGFFTRLQGNERRNTQMVFSAAIAKET